MLKTNPFEKIQSSVSLLVFAARLTVPVIYIMAQETWISLRGSERPILRIPHNS